MIRFFIILFLFCSTLQAQQSNWQSYVYISSFNDGADLGETIWFSTYNAIVKYNKGSEEPEVYRQADFGLTEYVRGMIKGRDGQLFFLEGQNGQIIEWKDGQYTRWPLDPFLSNVYVYDLLGETIDGALLLRTSSGFLVRFHKEEGASYLASLPVEMNGTIRDAHVTEDGHILVWSYSRVMLLNNEGDVLEDQVFNDEFIYHAQLNNDGFIWLLTNLKIRNWSPITENWISMNTQDLSEFYPNKLHVLSDGRALLSSSYNDMRIFSEQGGGFDWEQVDPGLFDYDFPAYTAFLDEDDRFWYMNTYNYKLTHWKEGEVPVTVSGQPWLSASNIFAVNEDKQGRIWIGGFGSVAYLLGGEWNLLPIVDRETGFLSGDVNDIAFTADNRPVIGTGTLGFFGPSPSFVFEWNGETWDTLHQAVLGATAFPVTDVEIDQNDNLWVLRDFDNFFSVRSQGEWIRFKTTDTPLDANVFTFLKEGLDGKMWIGADKGIVVYDGYRFSSIDSTTLSLEEAFTEDVFFDDKGQIWVTTSSKGIRKWNGSGWEIVDIGLDVSMLPAFKKIIQGVENEMWVTLDWDGVLHFDGQQWEHLTFLNSGLVENQVLSIIKDNEDRIWFGCQSSLSVLHPDEKTITPFRLTAAKFLEIYPNPGCCQFRVHWQLKTMSNVEIKLINPMGQMIRNWNYTAQEVGEYQMDFRQDDLPMGTYFIQLLVDQKTIESVPLIMTK